MPSWNPTLPSFGDVHPNLVREWSWLENPDVDPYHASPAGKQKVHWRCAEHGHHKFASFAEKARYPRCEVCIGNKVLTGFNDFPTTHPEKLAQWDYLLNRVHPEMLSAGSGVKAFWRCPSGFPHSWDASIVDIVLNLRGCPFCSGHRLLSGFNDLATLFPHLLQEWDWVKNVLSPDKIMPSSRTTVFWRCLLGHEWSGQPGERTNLGRGCPTCSGKRVLIGFNDFASQCAELLREWDWELNTLLPTEVTKGSNFKVRWTCYQGHRWGATISNRVARGSGCPKCSKSVSKSETLLYKALLAHYPQARQTVKVDIPGANYRNGYSVDIMITSSGGLDAVIEYDGEYWHKDWVERDTRKTRVLLDEGLRVVRLRENALCLLKLDHSNFYEFNFPFKGDSAVAADHIAAWLNSQLKTFCQS